MSIKAFNHIQVFCFCFIRLRNSVSCVIKFEFFCFWRYLGLLDHWFFAFNKAYLFQWIADPYHFSLITLINHLSLVIFCFQWFLFDPDPQHWFILLQFWCWTYYIFNLLFKTIALGKAWLNVVIANQLIPSSIT